MRKKMEETYQFILQLKTVRVIKKNSQKNHKMFALNWFLKILIADKENMVKIIIDTKADMIDVKNDWGQTPLFLAAANNGKIPFEHSNIQNM